MYNGQNGAGKTTTARILTGVIRADEGSAMVMGCKAGSLGAKQISGVVPEMANPYVDSSGWDNLMLMAELYGVPPKGAKERSTHLLNDLGLLERKNDRVQGYSKGMKQRLTVCMALLSDPQVLFLDEPTSGLDVQSGRLIKDLLATTSLSDPIAILEQVMAHPSVPMHGPEHHVMVPTVIIAAVRNAGYNIPEGAIEKALERASKVPGGWCGLYGDCGAAVGLGIAVSVLTNATPLTGKQRSLALRATSLSINLSTSKLHLAGSCRTDPSHRLCQDQSLAVSYVILSSGHSHGCHRCH